MSEQEIHKDVLAVIEEAKKEYDIQESFDRLSKAANQAKQATQKLGECISEFESDFDGFNLFE